MSSVLQVADPTGTRCCDCAAQLGGCSCAAGCIMKCRAIAGSAQFCGYPEYIPSTPPLYYRTRSLGGGFTTTCSGASLTGCNNPTACSQSFTYSGSSKYDKFSCTVTDTGQLVQSGNCQSGSTTPVNDVDASFVNTIEGVNLNLANKFFTNAKNIVGGPNGGQCNVSGSGFNGCIMPVTTSISAVLSDLDTIDDAVFRSIGPNPAYTSPNNGDCFASTSYSTAWTSKTFAFSKAQVQVTIPSSHAGLTYAVTITLLERATGSSGPMTPYGLINVTLGGVEGTTLSPWIDIPIVEGIQIAASACSVVQTP